MILRVGFIYARITFPQRVFVRLKSCHSCGIKLQAKDERKAGFYIEPRVQAQRSLDVKDVKYLLFSQDIQSLKHAEKPDEEESEPEYKRLVCKRCRDALAQNKYDMKDFRPTDLNNVLKHIPAGGDLVHMVPLTDFPMHLSKEVLQTLVDNKNSVTLVLTKADQVVPSQKPALDILPNITKRFLENAIGFAPAKVVAISSKRFWNLESLYTYLKKYSFLVGSPNTGKSTTINSLLRKYMGYKGVLKKDGSVELSINQSQNSEVKNYRNYLKMNTTGVSHIPNMTREPQPYILGDKVLFDMPGFSEDQNSKLIDIIRKDWLEKIQKNKLPTAKLKNKRYISVRGIGSGHCYTIGGLFFLIPPTGTINRIRSYIQGESHSFKNVERGLQVFKECNLSPDHPLEKKCGLNEKYCDIKMFTRYVLPPFQGKIELVFKDLGYISINPTGKYEYRGLYEVWCPKGVKVCVREPLDDLIANELGTANKIIRERPMVSSLYPVDPLETNVLRSMKETYLDIYSKANTKCPHSDINPMDYVSEYQINYPNLYWYYNW